MQNNLARDYMTNIMGHCWETCDFNSLARHIDDDCVTHNSEQQYPLLALKERMQNYGSYYSSRSIIVDDSMLIDNKLISKYHIHGIDERDSQSVKQEFVEIFTLEKDIIKEIWIIGDLGFSYKDSVNDTAKSKNSFVAARSSVEGHNFLIRFRSVLNNNSEVRLTERQAECLYYIMLGHTAKEIAQILGLSYRTIESYMEILKSKYSCKTKKDLIRKFMLQNAEIFS